MKRLLPILLLVFSVGVATAGSLAKQVSGQFLPSVVTIVSVDKNNQPMSLGSGFFLNHNGRIVTNYHVLEGAASSYVKTKGGKTARIQRITNADTVLDLVIAETGLTDTPVAPLGDSDLITVGEDVVAIGNPRGLEGTVSSGIISGVRRWDDLKFIQITAPISPGSSGGPVFNSEGKVIGVATVQVAKGQNLNFAMPVNYLAKLEKFDGATVTKRKTKKEKVAGMKGSAVRVRDVIKEYRRRHLTITIANDSQFVAKDFKILFIWKNKKGEVIGYDGKRYHEPILPGLAKQVYSPKVPALSVYFKNGAMEPVGPTYEIRLLDYTIDQNAPTAPLDALFKD